MLLNAKRNVKIWSPIPGPKLQVPGPKPQAPPRHWLMPGNPTLMEGKLKAECDCS